MISIKEEFKVYLEWFFSVKSLDLNHTLSTWADVLDVIEIVMEFEKRFSCAIDDDILDNEYLTFNEFIDELIKRKEDYDTKKRI